MAIDFLMSENIINYFSIEMNCKLFYWKKSSHFFFFFFFEKCTLSRE